MKYKNLKINFVSYSIFLYISGLVASIVSFPVFNNRKIEVEPKYLYECVEETMQPVQEEIIDIDETEDENMEVALFTNNDDYYDLDANEYVTEAYLKNTENFEITTDNQTFEHLSDDNFELFAAVVASECKNTDIYDALATASSIANRCDSEKWIEYVNSYGFDGENPIDQITFYGQYEGYLSGEYEKYLDGNVSTEVMDACEAVWYNGIRNNNYCSFRAASIKGYSDIQLVEDGNRFDDEIEPIKVYR